MITFSSYRHHSHLIVVQFGYLLYFQLWLVTRCLLSALKLENSLSPELEISCAMNQEYPEKYLLIYHQTNLIITILNDESVLSFWVLEHRKIIVSDVWQLSIFSKAVRIQLCCWSWAAHPHNVWVDWLGVPLLGDHVFDVHIIPKVGFDTDSLIWFPERVTFLWTILIAKTKRPRVSITSNIGSTQKLSNWINVSL